MKKSLQIIILIVLVVIIGVIGYFYWQGHLGKSLVNQRLTYNGKGCVGEFEWFQNYKYKDAFCCEGLIMIDAEITPIEDLPYKMDKDSKAVNDDNCYFGSFTPSSICVNCGDDICGVGENRCNCPSDCD